MKPDDKNKPLFTASHFSSSLRCSECFTSLMHPRVVFIRHQTGRDYMDLSIAKHFAMVCCNEYDMLNRTRLSEFSYWPPVVCHQQVEWKMPPTLAPWPTRLLYSAMAFSVCRTISSTPLCLTKSTVEDGTCSASLMPRPMTRVATPF